MNLNRFIGIPYKSKGGDWLGVDCYGLCRLFMFVELGKEIPTYADDYKSAEDKVSVSDAILKHVKSWVPVEGQKQPGDIVIFNIGNKPLHCGVLLNSNDFLHCLEGTRSCVERLNSITWGDRLAGVYRWTR